MIALNSDDHRSLDSGIMMTVLATVAVLLRLWMRHHSQALFSSDDFFTIFGLLSMFAWLGVLVWGTDLSSYPWLSSIETLGRPSKRRRWSEYRNHCARLQGVWGFPEGMDGSSYYAVAINLPRKRGAESGVVSVHSQCELCAGYQLCTT